MLSLLINVQALALRTPVAATGYCGSDVYKPEPLYQQCVQCPIYDPIKAATICGDVHPGFKCNAQAWCADTILCGDPRCPDSPKASPSPPPSPSTPPPPPPALPKLDPKQFCGEKFFVKGHSAVQKTDFCYEVTPCEFIRQAPDCSGENCCSEAFNEGAEGVFNLGNYDAEKSVSDYTQIYDNGSNEMCGKDRSSTLTFYQCTDGCTTNEVQVFENEKCHYEIHFAGPFHLATKAVGVPVE